MVDTDGYIKHNETASLSSTHFSLLFTFTFLVGSAMRSLPFLSFALAAVRFGAAETFSRRALTRANIEQYVENIIIVKDDFSGMLLEIDVGNNEVLVQVDLST